MQLADIGDPEIAHPHRSNTRWPIACKRRVPELMDIAKEPATIHEMYGTEPGKLSFANNCLLARRLVERGVRFVQLYHWGWDSHGTTRATTSCMRCPSAAGKPTRPPPP